ncbi:MAG: prolipoprotein diacylglyceryl transferase [Treponema sp.]|nr:prolipoprotein diacylglyceryl transferase [Treponema sp.]
MIVTGILSGGAICKKLCVVQNINFYDFIVISAVAGGLGFVGAKLLYILDFYSPRYFFNVLGYMLLHPKTSGLIEGGFVFYGGLIGGIAGYFLGIKIAGTDACTFLNTFAFVIPYVHAFGRIGCFCAGCCYGIEYTGPLSVAGHFPVQLLEALLLFAFAFVILGLVCKRSRNEFGMTGISLFLYYILYYSILRFFLEFLRGDEARGRVSFETGISLSISQIISLILFTAGIILIVLIKIRKNDKVRQVEATEIQND